MSHAEAIPCLLQIVTLRGSGDQRGTKVARTVAAAVGEKA